MFLLDAAGQGGLAPLAFKRQAFPWRDAGPRLLRKKSEAKGEARGAGWVEEMKFRKTTRSLGMPDYWIFTAFICLLMKCILHSMYIYISCGPVQVASFGFRYENDA